MTRGSTELKHVKKALAESEEWHRALGEVVEKSGHGITIIQNTPEREAVIVFVNDEACRIMGYSRGEALTMSAWDFFEPSELAAIQERYRRRQRGEQVPSYYETSVLHKNGRYIPVETSLSNMTYQGKIATVIHFQDITKRKRAEEELAKSVAKYRSLIETASAGVATIDLKGDLSLVNEALCDMVGYSPEYLIGKNFGDFLYPDDRARVLDLFANGVAGQDEHPAFEFRTIHRDGHIVWLYTSPTALVQEDGKIGFSAIIHDITPLKQMEQELNRHRQHLEELVEERTTELKRINEQLQHEIAERKKAEEALLRLSDAVRMSTDSIVITDLQGKIIDVNEATLKIQGTDSKADLIGLDSFNIIFPEVRERAFEDFLEIMERGYLRDVQYHVLTRDGRKILVETNASIMKDKKGEPIGIVAVSRDVTARKRMEDALRESEEKLRLYFENISDVVFLIDSELRILNVSPSIERISVFKTEELIGKLLSEINVLASQSWEQVTSDLTRVLAGERIVSRIFEIVARDGRRRFGEVSAAPIFSPEGKFIAAICVGREVTERKKAEEELQKLYQQEKDLRQQLEAEMKKRVEFTRALAHELKTPLTPMLISSQVLASELKDEPLLSLAKNLSRGALNLNSRIDELLDLAKGEIGILQLRTEPLSILQLLHEVAEYVSPVASSRQQSLILELPDSLPLVKADKGRLRQVVLNLLNNAFKFTPGGGNITLRASKKNASLLVEVKDNGPGIDKAEQQHIFEPYHPMEVDGERLSGLGLGLALCRTLVELHGGQIWVKSRLGKGSTFGFTLPLENSQQ